MTRPILLTSGALVVAMIVSGCGSGGDRATTTVAGAEAISADAPSQSTSDADRDGVVAEIAALPPPQRIRPLVAKEALEGTWLLSRLGDNSVNAAMAAGGVVGDSSGSYPEDYVYPTEYGEILLLDARGEIERAYPMPGAIPSWLHLNDDYLYAGRVGDGALPDATLVRIDRATFDARVVVLPAPVDGGVVWPADWHVATLEQIEDGPRPMGQAGDMAGIPVESWIGPVVIDVGAIEALLALFD